MTTHPLNFMALIAALAGMQAAVPVQAAISMISVQHRVWGDAGEPPAYRNFYDESGPAPLSRSADGITNTGGGNHASSTASAWSINAYRAGDAFYGNAHAQNTYVFRALSREISISLNGVIGVWWFENHAKMTLTNLGTHTLVSEYQSPFYTFINPFPIETNDMADYPFNWDTSVEVDPGDEYELIILVGAHRGEGGDGSAWLNLTIIPEPGGTLLSGIAVLVMCLRRHRRRV